MEDCKKEQNQCDEDLGNYITQVATDVGPSINKELFMTKIAQQVPKKSSGLLNKKMR
jgi:hypothetical protein